MTVCIRPGSGSFTITDRIVHPGAQLTVWHHRPEGFDRDSPILFVMHGTKRNAVDYRQTWISVAQRHSALLLCPELSKSDYPRALYQLGNLVDDTGAPLPTERWTYGIIEQLFDLVREHTGSHRQTYDIYGHSAGGQFVHRLALFCPEARYGTAIAANAGWYTMPTFEGDTFPHGLRQSPASMEQLASVLARRLLVLVGSNDADPHHHLLRDTKKTRRQGGTRYERAHAFVDTARAEANRIGTELNWELVSVAGARHDDREMLPAATRRLFE